MAVSHKPGEQAVQESSVIEVHLSDIHDAVTTIQDMGIQTASAAEEQSSVAEGCALHSFKKSSTSDTKI